MENKYYEMNIAGCIRSCPVSVSRTIWRLQALCFWEMRSLW